MEVIHFEKDNEYRLTAMDVKKEDDMIVVSMEDYAEFGKDRK